MTKPLVVLKRPKGTSSMSIDTEEDSVIEMKQKKPKGLEGLQLQKIDGVNHFTFTLGPDLVVLHNLVRGLHVRPDDVISVGFPRSGNHWTFEIVSMILSQTTEFQKDHFYARLMECLGMGVQEILDKVESPRNLTSHCRIHNIPQEAIQSRTKLIYVIRNPKDVLVSLYKFTSSLAYEGSRFKGTWDEFFELQMQGEFPHGYWFDHVRATESFRMKHPQCPIFFVVYEKLKKNPVGEIKKLCSFLNQSDHLADDIAHTTQFSNMKSVLSRTKLAIQGSLHFRNGPDDILRKGIVGDWKNWFTVSQNEAFNKLFETKMAGSSIADLVRDYI